MNMSTKQLITKLGIKLLGKKQKPVADIRILANEKTQPFALVDGLGVIELHPYWRN